MINNTKTKINFDMQIILAVFIIARFSCIALSNIPLMTIGFSLLYSLVFIGLFFFLSTTLSRLEVFSMLSLFIYVFEVAIITVSTTGEIINSSAFNAYVLVALYFIYLYMKKCSDKKRKTICTVALVGYVFTFIYSIFKLVEDPMLSRLAATGSLGRSEEVDTLNAIGGFDTVYGGLLVLVCMFYLRGVLNKKYQRALCDISLIVGVVFIIMASYGTAIVLLFASLCMLLFFRSKPWRYAVLVFMVLGLILHDVIGEMLMSFSENIKFSEVLEEKVYQIGYILKTGESTGTLSGNEGRLARMGWSWDAFKKYPIFGGFFRDDIKIGYHSEFFDTLGKFGLVGFCSLVSFFYCFFTDVYNNFKTKTEKNNLIIVVIIYLLTSFLDPSLYTQQILPLFIFLPFLEKTFSQVKTLKRLR